MTNLSVNINKIATIRNARGGETPNIVDAALSCEEYGAQGITVHPRPDERHIKYKDVYDLKPLLHTEFNIEGYPSRKFIKLVTEVRPTQVTLVPDAPDALTSNSGWDTIAHKSLLQDIIAELKAYGMRTSVFIDASPEKIVHAAETGTDRVELYTEPYARIFPQDRDAAIRPFIKAANTAEEVKLGLNAGHDLNLDNLRFFADNISNLLEVSIGHALISDSLYMGLEQTIHMYLKQLQNT
ncbi:MAG: pyridoxine 5'-phosphate synthase [Bacteroidales bacterium]